MDQGQTSIPPPPSHQLTKTFQEEYALAKEGKYQELPHEFVAQAMEVRKLPASTYFSAIPTALLLPRTAA